MQITVCVLGKNSSNSDNICQKQGKKKDQYYLKKLTSYLLRKLFACMLMFMSHCHNHAYLIWPTEVVCLVFFIQSTSHSLSFLQNISQVLQDNTVKLFQLAWLAVSQSISCLGYIKTCQHTFSTFPKQGLIKDRICWEIICRWLSVVVKKRGDAHS